MVEVATWRPAAEGENGTHELKALPGAPKRVETNTYCTIRPVFREDEGGRSLSGFEIAVLAGARPSTDKGEIDPTAATEEGCGEEAEPEDKPIEYTKIVIDLPAQPSDQLRYGLLLKPVWKEKEEGKKLEAFDISLASMPLQRAEG
jgi:hypothetical protein